MDEKDLLKLADLIVEKLRQCPLQVIVNVPQPQVAYVPSVPVPCPTWQPTITCGYATTTSPCHNTC